MGLDATKPPHLINPRFTRERNRAKIQIDMEKQIPIQFNLGMLAVGHWMLYPNIR